MKTIHGVRIPDSRLARDAEALLTGSSPDFLEAHCRRSYVLGVLAVRSEGREFDEELAYVAALLHDLGLAERYGDERRFELSGADAARDWALGNGLSHDEAQVVWDAIAFHSAMGIAHAHAPETALVCVGSAIDVAGAQAGPALPEGALADVFRSYPRGGLADRLPELLETAVRRNPESYALSWLAATAERCHDGHVGTSEDFVRELRIDPHAALIATL